jgi:hypothetical protein
MPAKASTRAPEWVPPVHLLGLPPVPDWADSLGDVSLADVARTHSVSTRSIAAWRRMGEKTGVSIGGRCPLIEGYHYYWKHKSNSIRYHLERFELWCTEDPCEHVRRINAWAKTREIAS